MVAVEMLRFFVVSRGVRQGGKMVGGLREAGGERSKTSLKVFRKEKRAL